ncbi:MAG: DUF4349 domain-containing protein [Patescibacteria group bacterium]
MPQRSIWRPTVILFVIFSVALIALIISLVVKSTAKMDWQSAPAFNESATVSMAPGIAPMPSDMGIAVGKESFARDMMPVPPTAGASADDRLRVGPKIVKNGSLRLRVKEADRALEELKTLATNAGGYAADTRVYEVNGGREATITLRIPVAKFDETVSAAKRLSILVLEESATAEDVTDQYVDMDARLTAAKAEEAQYLEILKKAKTVEDIIRVTPYLNETRRTIEQLEGQLRYLSARTDYATLNVTVTEETKIVAPTRTWKPGETLRQAVQFLIVAAQALVDVGIVAIVIIIGLLIPVLAVIALVIWLVRRAWLRWMNHR